MSIKLNYLDADNVKRRAIAKRYLEKIKNPKYFYKVTFEKPGGLVMPIIAEYTYEDGSKEIVKYPAEIWRLNDKEVSKAIASDKEIVSIVVDPYEETADIDTSNNAWPSKETKSDFDAFKEKVRGKED